MPLVNRRLEIWDVYRLGYRSLALIPWEASSFPLSEGVKDLPRSFIGIISSHISTECIAVRIICAKTLREKVS